jgi:D-alanine-D-alanine ligase-like ATP-grasp enzyme
LRRQVTAYYVDAQTRAHAIPAAMLYSNTPSDFDFRLRQTEVDGTRSFGSLEEFAAALATGTDLVFPAMHGRFGEDGAIQQVRETEGLPLGA